MTCILRILMHPGLTHRNDASALCQAEARSGIPWIRNPMRTRASAYAHLRYLLAADLAAFVLGLLLLLLASRLPSFLSPLALAILIAGLAVWFGLHIVLWLFSGIRSVEISAGVLIVYRGRRLEADRIERRSLSEIRIRRRLGRRTVTLLHSSGKRTRISEDAFAAEAFSQFLAALETWRRS